MFEVALGQSADAHFGRPKPPGGQDVPRVRPGSGIVAAVAEDWLPAEHLARFIAELVDEHVDLVRLRAANTAGRGASPDDPRLMVRILLYGYITGVRSSRVIERQCVDDVAFRWLADGSAPDYRAIARFHKRHLSALGHLFVQALALCQAAGMVRLGQVALDVTLGKSSRGDESPEQLWRHETRFAKVREANAALMAEAGQRDRQRAAPKRTAQRARWSAPSCWR